MCEAMFCKPTTGGDMHGYRHRYNTDKKNLINDVISLEYQRYSPGGVKCCQKKNINNPAKILKANNEISINPNVPQGMRRRK